MDDDSVDVRQLETKGALITLHDWDKVANPRATVLIVHGYGHHGGSFAEVAGQLNAAGYVVRAFDQRGHGSSTGRRGYINDFNDYVSDTGEVVSVVREQLDGKPLFLMGHSLGCLALATYVIQQKPEDVRGLIFSSGLLKIPDHVPAYLQRLAGFLGAVLPLLPVQKVDYTATSRDPEAVKKLLDDPLQLKGMMQARTGAEIAKAVAALQQSMDRIALPLLILHGTDDRLTDTEGSRQLHARARSTDKTLRIFEGGYHELYNDLEKQKFMDEVIGWLNAHT